MPTKTINDLTATADILDADELAFWNVANARTDKITYAELKTDLFGGLSGDTEILFNNAGNIDGDPRLTYNPATNIMTLGGQFTLSTSGAPSFENIVSTATVPTIIHNNTDTTTGTGGVSGEYSIITGGGERLKVTDTLITSNVAFTVGAGNLRINNGNLVVVAGSINMNGNDITTIDTLIGQNGTAILTPNGNATRTFDFAAVDTDAGPISLVFARLTSNPTPTFEIFSPAGGTTTIVTDALTFATSPSDYDGVIGTNAQILIRDDTTGVVEMLTIGTGLTRNGTTLEAVGGGDVTKVGTPVNNQVGVWTGDGTIEGVGNFVFVNGLLSTAENQGGNIGYNIINNNAVTGTASVNIAVGSVSTGDPFLRVGVTATRSYAFGIDNSDSDILKITTDTFTSVTPSSGTTLFSITDAGLTTIHAGNLVISTHDIVTDTTTGTKIGTATNQKLGFFDATPIIQQTTASQTAATFVANSSGISDDTATWNGYTIGDLVAILQAFGFMA